ncbi:hypothetical protein BDF20DRAFT_230208 [Mycotypha africana]|uniref:uncharacterized protein n=1 Tax=Mycotypha africana TaxID=64632 RepID=UPI002300E5C1|nr:uncharacterized protein BDF20DRAFT_230208 [Mycotypha africana]KAI8967341.1 hypothetical protein BDF20DRAFT_230208 [Mycotypha africana]
MNYANQAMKFFLVAIISIITMQTAIKAMPFPDNLPAQGATMYNEDSSNFNNWINQVSGRGASAQTVQTSTTEVSTADGQTFLIDNIDGTIKQTSGTASKANSGSGVPVRLAAAKMGQSTTCNLLIIFYCSLGLTMYYLPFL